ncbi:YheC/YheD family protein [Radiobacillus sp. PE A8.2]|uniref:YheC/YheD family protein n=1 Tax=Radiobacillus sp. PE A8.2 TaxID=3380349 RepID=UPI00388D67D8
MDNHTVKNSGASMIAIFDKERLYFNKWEMYKLLSQHDLPFTMPYTEYLTEQALDQFLYGDVPFFIKPVDTWAGKHITFIKRVLNGYAAQHPDGSGGVLPNNQALKQSLYEKYQNTQAIIQQQAPIISYDTRAFDIRVHLQRDEHGHWLYAGDLIRIGGKQSIVSNLFMHGGGVVTTESVLQDLFHNTHVTMIKDNLANAALGVAQILDRYYPFIDIGVDFGIDEHGNLWLLEVNTNDKKGRPGYDLFKKLPDKSVFKKMKAKDKQRLKVWQMQQMHGGHFR